MDAACTKVSRQSIIKVRGADGDDDDDDKFNCVWEIETNRLLARALKNLHALQTMVDEFPKENCPNTDMFALRDKMKAKMKVIGSLLGFHQKFQEENPSSKLLY